MMEEMNSTMIYLLYCKNFCKCHNVLSPSTTIKKKKKKKRKKEMRAVRRQRNNRFDHIKT
jgi:hypothetical protein